MFAICGRFYKKIMIISLGSLGKQNGQSETTLNDMLLQVCNIYLN